MYTSMLGEVRKKVIRLYPLKLSNRPSKPGHKVIKLLTCSTQVSVKFILFIDV